MMPKPVKLLAISWYVRVCTSSTHVGILYPFPLAAIAEDFDYVACLDAVVVQCLKDLPLLFSAHD